jgi:hypothetical protein
MKMQKRGLLLGSLFLYIAVSLLALLSMFVPVYSAKACTYHSYCLHIARDICINQCSYDGGCYSWTFVDGHCSGLHECQSTWLITCNDHISFNYYCWEWNDLCTS